jgi:protein phosphatase
MGTTATIAAFRGKRLFFGQVGDSRAYLLRAGKLIQVTRDQSLVNQLIEAGQLTEEEAETFEHNNIILQALGTAESVQVDLTFVDLRKGDTLMMCSDGLSGMIRADEIRDVLLGNEDPLAACKELTDRANGAGGHDNITVIVAKFDDGLPDPNDSDGLAYQKYALPETPTEIPEAPNPVGAGHFSTGPMSEEAQRESRQLRVSHTMVGMVNPMAGEANPDPPSSDSRHPSSSAPSVYSADDEPVHIPTTGLPPAAVGFMVLGAMVVVAVAGFLLLR